LLNILRSLAQAANVGFQASTSVCSSTAFGRVLPDVFLDTGSAGGRGGIQL